MVNNKMLHLCNAMNFPKCFHEHFFDFVLLSPYLFSSNLPWLLLYLQKLTFEVHFSNFEPTTQSVFMYAITIRNKGDKINEMTQSKRIDGTLKLTGLNFLVWRVEWTVI